ncbi:MAG: ribonuclease R [Bacteroidota bacterium]
MLKKKKNSSSANRAQSLVTGRVDHVSPAYAYIVPQDGDQPDIWVREENLLGALHKDIVQVKIHLQNKVGRVTGRVVAIVERNAAPIVGRLVHRGKVSFVIPDGRRMHHEIVVRPEELKGAQNDDKVIVKITDWPNGSQEPSGVIQEVLGPAGTHEVEMHAIMAEFGLPTRFPTPVMVEANAIPTAIPKSELARRKDLRVVPTMTIDPEDAKDFDDALSLRKLSNGHYEVGIHIADASYYVPEGGLLDQEALERGTSVYLVDRTVSMLPEKLSNELCSLRPQEDKLTFSAIFELDSRGKVHKEWIGESVIHSDKRFTYEEAQQIITNQSGLFCEELTLFNQLAKQLRAQRFRQGAINFETPEVRFELDEQGKPLRIVPKVRQDTHKLVEEFMLLANTRVATRVAKMQPGKNRPTFIYRTHDHPDPDKLNDFWLFVKQLGYAINPKQQSVPQAINTVTTAVEGQVAENIVQSLAIRTMAKALYTTEAKGHFGLAFQHYTHFTSPIRRYPDIMVHRLLKQYLQGNFQADARAYEAQCRHASEREKVAADAERASVRYKQVEWMQALQGQVLDGVISGVTEWGLYVELTDNFAEGMVRLADMTDDYYMLDEKGFKVVGRRSKKTYRLSDQVRVRVKDCDLTRRTVSLSLVAKGEV